MMKNRWYLNALLLLVGISQISFGGERPIRDLSYAEFNKLVPEFLQRKNLLCHFTECLIDVGTNSEDSTLAVLFQDTKGELVGCGFLDRDKVQLFESPQLTSDLIGALQTYKKNKEADEKAEAICLKIKFNGKDKTLTMHDLITIPAAEKSFFQKHTGKILGFGIICLMVFLMRNPDLVNMIYINPLHLPLPPLKD